MDELVIYGASDDLIEIISTSFGDEEFYVDCGNPGILTISDGTALRIRYDEEGVWRFTPIFRGNADFTVELGMDDRRHSDKVTLTGDNLNWVALATHIAK